MYTLILELQIWAESRPEHEHIIQGEQINTDLEQIDVRETNQGTSFSTQVGLFFGMLERIVRTE